MVLKFGIHSAYLSFVIRLFSPFTVGEEKYMTVLRVNQYLLSCWNLDISAVFHLCTYKRVCPPLQNQNVFKTLIYYVSAFVMELNKESYIIRIFITYTILLMLR
jgi:hypothetical protein